MIKVESHYADPVTIYSWLSSHLESGLTLFLIYKNLLLLLLGLGFSHVRPHLHLLIEQKPQKIVEGIAVFRPHREDVGDIIDLLLTVLLLPDTIPEYQMQDLMEVNP